MKLGEKVYMLSAQQILIDRLYSHLSHEYFASEWYHWTAMTAHNIVVSEVSNALR